jgi:hypothetical protein
MKILDDGIFQVRDGEVVTLDIRSTGAETLFGVVYSIYAEAEQGIIPGGSPFRITMDITQAEGDSDIPNARSTVLALTFSFTSASGGRYDLTVRGRDKTPSYPDFAIQAGRGPTQIPYTFHITP